LKHLNDLRCINLLGSRCFLPTCIGRCCCRRCCCCSAVPHLQHVPLLPETIRRLLLPPYMQTHVTYLKADRQHGAAELAGYVLQALLAAERHGRAPRPASLLPDPPRQQQRQHCLAAAAAAAAAAGGDAAVLILSENTSITNTTSSSSSRCEACAAHI